MAYGITQCYLPPSLHADVLATCHPAEVRILPLPPAEAGTVLDLATPEGCKAELTYVT